MPIAEAMQPWPTAAALETALQEVQHRRMQSPHLFCWAYFLFASGCGCALAVAHEASAADVRVIVVRAPLGRVAVATVDANLPFKGSLVCSSTWAQRLCHCATFPLKTWSSWPQELQRRELTGGAAWNKLRPRCHRQVVFGLSPCQ